jgi:OOP family OmpA-OmpF porin
LSERRAATVRQALIELGLPGVAAARVEVSAAGDAKPVQACDGHFATKAQLEECLLPNRRVELVVTALPATKP